MLKAQIALLEFRECLLLLGDVRIVANKAGDGSVGPVQGQNGKPEGLNLSVWEAVFVDRVQDRFCVLENLMLAVLKPCGLGRRPPEIGMGFAKDVCGRIKARSVGKGAIAAKEFQINIFPVDVETRVLQERVQDLVFEIMRRAGQNGVRCRFRLKTGISAQRPPRKRLGLWRGSAASV